MASAKEPRFSTGFLGPQSKFKAFGLGVLSHTDAKIHMKEWEGNELRIEICYSDPVKTTFSLFEANTNEDRSDCVFAQTNTEDQTISYHMTIPAPGFWKFQIFALPQSDPSKSLAGVYNYLIHCVKAPKRAYPRPKQFKDWKDGCILKEPMVLHRDVTGPTVRFRVIIPDANKVAVVVEQEWTHLMKIDDEWTGNVVLGKHGKYYGTNASVTLNALYGPEGGSYSTLLEYTI